MRRPRLLDLYCGAGGAGAGYHRAGFDVVGVDIRPQPHYPFEFHQADALAYLAEHGAEFDAIHASPPCQEYSCLKSLKTRQYPDLIEPTRELLLATGRPYVIENVPGAPLRDAFMLCGTMFGLRVIRHRLFECSWPMWFAPATCCHNGYASGNKKRKRDNDIHTTPTLEKFKFLTVTGNDYLAHEGRLAMGIDWMTKRELSQAIPPKYTEFIGRALLETFPANQLVRPR